MEDTDATIEEIAGQFGSETAEAVRCMTHRANESYESYLVRAKSNPISRLVKISDLIDNSNLSRLPVVTLKDVARQQKYNRSLRFMMTCCTFFQDSAEAAGNEMNLEIVKEYDNGVPPFDGGKRRLYRCRKCGCFIFSQFSEHGFSGADGCYAGFYPVANITEADRINAACDPLPKASMINGRYLQCTNGKYQWFGAND